MLRAVLNKSWRQHPTRLQLYGHLPPITKTIQVRRSRHAGHCWRSKDELISDVLLWTPTHGCARVGRPARTYIQQLCENTGCNPEDLPEAMNDREKWRETVRDIRAGGATWWWLFPHSEMVSIIATLIIYLILIIFCGPMLVMVPSVVWLLVTVLVVAVVFVTITYASDCLLCQVLPCPHCVWKIHKEGLTQFSRIFFWQSGNMSD